ncbi:MAG: hypothetical protein GWP66_08740 [Gammaproteobacteria bacterium]|jgi:hypothetical protein|nr:hypothetical protein [Gammaproteobacteria bacterium]
MSRRLQRGAALITAAFLVVGLGALGALMVRLVVFGSEESVVEWHSTQALHAAESGLDWAMHRIVFTSSPTSCDDGDGTDQVVVAGRAWFTVEAEDITLHGLRICRLTSTGKGGGSAAAALATRQVSALFMP